MNRGYKLIGLLIILMLIVAGCTDGETDTDQSMDQETNQTEEVVEQDENLEEPEDENEVENEIGDSTGEVKSKVLLDIMNTEEYTTEIQMITKTGQNESESLVTTAISGDKVYSSTETGSMMIKFIEKDDKLYQILDDSKMIIVSDRYEEEDEDMDFANRNLVYDDLEYVGEGTEEFLGNQRPYEEYTIDMGSVKYYFDGNNLDGMEVLIDREKLLGDDVDDEEFADMEYGSIIMKILSFEKETDDSLFELPEEYELVGQ